MRAVTDTNVVVSGLLWQGRPRQLLDAARSGRVEMFTSRLLLAELEDVLSRDKFVDQLRRAGLTAHYLVVRYGALAKLVEPAVIAPTILADVDDDAVLACALAARAEAIVSGDSHLLNLKEYRGIPILTVVDVLNHLVSSP